MSVTMVVIRRLHSECPDNHLWLEWERLPLVSLAAFRATACSLPALQAWPLENANWREVYEHFVAEADKQIDTHNELFDRQSGEDPSTYLQRMMKEVERVATEDKWSSYSECATCQAGRGQPCVSLRDGVVAKNPHPGRRKSKLPAAELPQETPAEELAPTTPAKRRQRPAVDSAVQSHNLIVTPKRLGDYDTFRATCSCGELDGSNWTDRGRAVKDHEDHVAAVMVSA